MERIKRRASFCLKNVKLCGIVLGTNLKIWQLQRTQKEEYVLVRRSESLTVRKDVIAKDKKAVVTDLSLAFKALDKAAKRGTIKKGNANRKKSRLAKAVAKLAAK